MSGDKRQISVPWPEDSKGPSLKDYERLIRAWRGEQDAQKEAVGLKFDTDKPRLELVDALATEGLAKVLTFGAKKYAANNWRNGIAYSRLLGGIERHLLAIKRGEDTDPESGLPHVDHLACGVMFLSNLMKTRPDLDDRWKPK